MDKERNHARHSKDRRSIAHPASEDVVVQRAVLARAERVQVLVLAALNLQAADAKSRPSRKRSVVTQHGKLERGGGRKRAGQSSRGRNTASAHATPHTRAPVNRHTRDNASHSHSEKRGRIPRPEPRRAGSAARCAATATRIPLCAQHAQWPPLVKGRCEARTVVRQLGRLEDHIRA